MELSSVKILRASAGSGKTYRLSYEYIKRVIVNPQAYASILAVTFTNKATEEMKSRIIESLNGLATFSLGDKVEYLEELMAELGMQAVEIKIRATQAKSFILHDYSNFAVSTIDKFFQRIARAFFKELGLDFGYEVELSGEHFLERAVAGLVEQSAVDEELRELIDRVVGEELESNRWNIKANLVKTGKILSSEGFVHSGKSAQYLIGVMDIARGEVERMEGEIRGLCVEFIRISGECGVGAMDFKYGKTGFGVFIEKIALGGDISPSGKRLIGATESDPAKDWTSKKGALDGVGGELQEVLRGVVTLNEDYQRFSNSYHAVNKHFSRFLLLERLSKELDQLWGESNRLPIHRTTSLIADIASTTETPFIYEKLGTNYDCYMIDEFQDTSHGQWQGFLPLLHEAISHETKECVMLIGDVKQAIYRWRGGDWNILGSQALKEFEERVDANEELSTNWRSLPQIVEFNNTILKHVIEQDTTAIAELTTSEETLHKAYGKSLQQAYVTYRQNAKPKSEGGYVELCQTDEPIEKTIATIRRLTSEKGYRLRDIAILVREKKRGNEIAQQLIAQQINVISDEALFINSSATVRFVINILRLIENPENNIAIAEINLHNGDPLENPLSEELREFTQNLTLRSPIAALETIIDHFSLRETDTSYLQALYQALFSFSNTQSADLEKFLRWWDESGKTTSLSLPKEQDAITVITIHKSKGLQFPAVIIPWADWNLMPRTGNTIWAKSEEPPFGMLGETLVEFGKSLENSAFTHDYVRESVYSHIDNINLLYVALTRPEKSLFVFTPQSPAKTSIGTLINEAVLKMDYKKGKEDNTYTFGILENYTAKESELGYTPVSFDTFESWNPADRIATTLPHFRVTQEQSIEDLDKRHYGLLMHEILSKIVTLNDIKPTIETLLLSGQITTEESQTLTTLLEKATSQPQVQKWFSQEWQVFNERQILLPKTTMSRRPDRVIIAPDGTAVVIDYKFGEKRKTHIAQVKSYTKNLTEMGYPSAKGYLWYVTTGEVIELN